jgi:hypothetical protein
MRILTGQSIQYAERQPECRHFQGLPPPPASPTGRRESRRWLKDPLDVTEAVIAPAPDTSELGRSLPFEGCR